MMQSNSPTKTQWQLPLGARVQEDGVFFRVWAPNCHQIDVSIEREGERLFPLAKANHGYFEGFVPNIGPGDLYCYRIDGDKKREFPDPCSRYQPHGPHQPSMVVDPNHYQWHDAEWRGIKLKGQVLYEMHIGAYTLEGTFDAAIQELDELKALGITVIELMPIAEFPGRWNQGYDGVSLFAPTHLYGDPDGLKRFVDRAHQLGLGVILDVVYNHFGPDGNYTGLFSDYYLSNKHHTAWGCAINYDDQGSEEVREFFINNACYWISEFHLDGLRLDSTQDIYDDSPRHILAEISLRTRAVAAPREIILIAENEPQDIKLIKPLDQGGFGLDGAWNDDFHHAAIVALKGRSEAYYSDYRGKAQEFVSLLKSGYLYQGQAYSWQGRPSRGKFVKFEPASSFVFYLQNHDQISNELRGERIHALTDAARYRTLAAVLLLAPETPLLFMGQEFASSKPFLFFADHISPELAKAVSEGRRKFMEQFPSFASAYESHADHVLHDVGSLASFERSKLDLSEREKNAHVYKFHKDLLRIRREDPVIAAQDRFALDGAVLDDFSFVIRFFGKDDDDRLLLVNLGRDLEYHPIPEPLLAPSEKGSWELMWSSEDPTYGGSGILNPAKKRGWFLPGQSAILLKTFGTDRTDGTDKGTKRT